MAAPTANDLYEIASALPERDAALIRSAADELVRRRKDVRDADEVLSDNRRLVRELDVALNGEAGAAKKASLCDVVAQVKDQRWRLVRE